MHDAKFMEAAIRKYINGCLGVDRENRGSVFAEDVVYTEGHGPMYRNKQELLCYLNNASSLFTVKRWDVKTITCVENKAFIEWYFAYTINGTDKHCDGVSIATFNENGFICKWEEFTAEADHYYPYNA